MAGKGAEWKFFSLLGEKMKKSKLTEIAVYGALALAGVLIFLSGGDKEAKTAEAPRAAAEDALASRLEEALMCIEGAGDIRVLLTYEGEDGQAVRGAILIAEGAGDISVRMKLEAAVTTALGIGINQVEIFEMKKTMEGGG